MNLTAKNSNVSEQMGWFGDMVQVQCDYGHGVRAINWNVTSFQTTCKGDYVWDVHELILTALELNNTAYLVTAFRLTNFCDSKWMLILR